MSSSLIRSCFISHSFIDYIEYEEKATMKENLSNINNVNYSLKKFG